MKNMSLPRPEEPIIMGQICFTLATIVSNEGQCIKMSIFTYMELNMPIRAVKQNPIANMDFILTCMTHEYNILFKYLQWTQLKNNTNLNK